MAKKKSEKREYTVKLKSVIEHEVTVEAENEDEARELAIDEANGMDVEDIDLDFTVVEIK